jgi:DNA-binding MarR family transcriptional regulator
MDNWCDTPEVVDDDVAEIASYYQALVPLTDTLAVRAVLVLVRTYGVIDAAIEDYLAPLSLSRARLNVLNILCRAPGRMLRMKDISAALNVSKSNITSLIDGLERDGLVERRPDLSDKRTVWVYLTSLGKHSLQTVLPYHLAQLAELMSCLSPDEKMTLAQLLTRLRTHIVETRRLSEGDGASRFPVDVREQRRRHVRRRGCR